MGEPTLASEQGQQDFVQKLKIMWPQEEFLPHFRYLSAELPHHSRQECLMLSFPGELWSPAGALEKQQNSSKPLNLPQIGSRTTNGPFNSTYKPV